MNNQNYPSPSASQATWSIVQGVNAGGNPPAAKSKHSAAAPPESPRPRPAASCSASMWNTRMWQPASAALFLETGTYWMTTRRPGARYPSGFEYNYPYDVEDNSPALGPGSEIVMIRCLPPRSLDSRTSLSRTVRSFAEISAANNVQWVSSPQQLIDGRKRCWRGSPVPPMFLTKPDSGGSSSSGSAHQERSQLEDRS